jgi:hypothetical protein
VDHAGRAPVSCGGPAGLSYMARNPPQQHSDGEGVGAHQLGGGKVAREFIPAKIRSAGVPGLGGK